MINNAFFGYRFNGYMKYGKLIEFIYFMYLVTCLLSFGNKRFHNIKITGVMKNN